MAMMLSFSDWLARRQPQRLPQAHEVHADFDATRDDWRYDGVEVMVEIAGLDTADRVRPAVSRHS